MLSLHIESIDSMIYCNHKWLYQYSFDKHFHNSIA